MQQNQEYDDYLIEKGQLENKINTHYKEKAIGACIRAKVKWIQEGESNSRFFLNLEKQRQGNNTINNLKVNDCKVTNDTDILKESLNFYKNLYKQTGISKHKIEKYFQKLFPKNTLNQNEKTFCDNLISKEELNCVVSKLKTNKSPGLDGLTGEFYQRFWDKLETLYMNMLQESFIKGILPSSIRKSVITLIFKSGDQELLKNYRPISLTNCDY